MYPANDWTKRPSLNCTLFPSGGLLIWKELVGITRCQQFLRNLILTKIYFYSIHQICSKRLEAACTLPSNLRCCDQFCCGKIQYQSVLFKHGNLSPEHAEKVALFRAWTGTQCLKFWTICETNSAVLCTECHKLMVWESYLLPCFQNNLISLIWVPVTS